MLSLHRVSQHCRVEHDSSETGACFHVTKQDGRVLDFQPSVSGLHCYDSREHGTTFAQTVAKVKEKCTVRACKRAVVARKLQDVVGRPSTRDHVKIVEGGMLRNCPITRADILAAEDIFGPNMGSLKGKTGRRKNMHVPSLVADVPCNIVKMHRDVTLCFDIMFVNKIAFLVTVSRNLRFGTTERLLSRNPGVAGKALVTVLKFHRQQGFRVKECHGDGEFESLRATLADAGSGLNVTGEDEHAPEVERHIRTTKERSRSSCDTVPFKTLPGMMIVELVHGRVCWLNSFPAKDGVLAVQSPRRSMTGQQADCGLHCQLDFGEHAQVHEPHDNSMASRTTGAIALRPTGNVQGGCYFMSLSTGRRLNRHARTPLPMSGEVIDRVHALAARNPAGSELLFGWRNGTEIPDTPTDEDDLHDEDYDPADDDSDDDSSQAPGPPPVAGVDNDIASDDEDDEDQGNAVTSGDEDQDEDQDDADNVDDIDDNDDDDDDDNGMPPLLPRTNDDDNDTDSSNEDCNP
jgi:hypothetical protein